MWLFDLRHGHRKSGHRQPRRPSRLGAPRAGCGASRPPFNSPRQCASTQRGGRDCQPCAASLQGPQRAGTRRAAGRPACPTAEQPDQRACSVVPDCWVEALGGLGRASIFIVGSPGHAEPQPPCLCPLDPHEVIVVLHARRGRPADGRCGDASSAGQQQCIGAREEECHGDTQEGHRVPRGCGLRRETSSQVPIWCTSQGKGSGTYLI